ncbi:hypothetical protein VP01_293g5 [Puccinia sorghi]|uniref:Uncharacterized protein n=1 Tax=Puccinia sorghi TaxID=27349 RepID=A0A0L6V109_9BASI|nr:hypothetical protein VP01_293g5 [Puccinia sorghi]
MGFDVLVDVISSKKLVHCVDAREERGVMENECSHMEMNHHKSATTYLFRKHLKRLASTLNKFLLLLVIVVLLDNTSPLEKKLAQLLAVDMKHAPTKLPSKLHLFACVDVLAQSICMKAWLLHSGRKVGVTPKALAGISICQLQEVEQTDELAALAIFANVDVTSQDVEKSPHFILIRLPSLILYLGYMCHFLNSFPHSFPYLNRCSFFLVWFLFLFSSLCYPCLFLLYFFFVQLLSASESLLSSFLTILHWHFSLTCWLNGITIALTMSLNNSILNVQSAHKRFHDTQTGVPFGIPKGARCVQRFDDSLNSAIHITYHISLCGCLHSFKLVCMCKKKFLKNKRDALGVYFNPTFLVGKNLLIKHHPETPCSFKSPLRRTKPFQGRQHRFCPGKNLYLSACTP